MGNGEWVVALTPVSGFLPPDSWLPSSAFRLPPLPRPSFPASANSGKSAGLPVAKLMTGTPGGNASMTDFKWGST
jgi:hypothetical protein